MFTILGADGKEYGPVTAGKLHEWIAGGRANLQTKARRASETEWKTLADYPEFGEFGANSGTGTTAPAVIAAAPGAAMPDLAVQGPVPAERGARLLAQIVDALTGLIVALPGAALLFIGSAGGNKTSPMAVSGAVLIGVALLTLLVVQIYLLTTCGQTVGKKLLDIRIVSFEDGSNPGFVKVFLLRVLVNGLVGAIPVVGFAYSLVDICFIFRPDRRCLHDLIAGTKVVKA